jgi:hypothetical protein
MKVKGLVDIPSKNGTISAGTIFNVSEQAFTKLTGKVELVPTMTATDAAKKISTVLVELDHLRPWPDSLWDLVTPDSLARIREANRIVDYAADELRDPAELDLALIEYRQAWVSALAEIRQ